MSSTCHCCGQIVPFGHNYDSKIYITFESEDELFEHMDFLISTYAVEADDKLTGDAIDLKRKLLQHLSTWNALINRKGIK